jgi:membrane protein DedA with SNARE-associated domain
MSGLLGPLVHLPPGLGYGAVALLVGGESAGVPLPGETALLAAAVLAAHGHMSLPLAVGAAAAGAIVGDNVGYAIGRRGLRRLATSRGGRLGMRRALLAHGEAFFRRHGAKAVFLGRWVTGVRMVVALLAGAHRMTWWRFALWNALGGGMWATSVGVTGYLLGSVAPTAFEAAGAAVIAAAAVWAGLALWRRRRARRRGAPRRPQPRPGRSSTS